MLGNKAEEKRFHTLFPEPPGSDSYLSFAALMESKNAAIEVYVTHDITTARLACSTR